MRPSQLLETHRAEIKEILKKYPGVSNIRVFGSVANGTDTEESDIDFVVDIERGVTLFKLGGLYDDLETILDVPVDLITSKDIPSASKAKILNEARPL